MLRTVMVTMMRNQLHGRESCTSYFQGIHTCSGQMSRLFAIVIDDEWMRGTATHFVGHYRSTVQLWE